MVHRLLSAAAFLSIPFILQLLESAGDRAGYGTGDRARDVSGFEGMLQRETNRTTDQTGSTEIRPEFSFPKY
jgi:hypothetical protein